MGDPKVERVDLVLGPGLHTSACAWCEHMVRLH